MPPVTNSKAANCAPSVLHEANIGEKGYHSDCCGDVFQEKMDTVFGKSDGLSGIADDTFVYGKSEVEHDQHIFNVPDTARDNNVRFNPHKFQFKADQTSFFGFTLTPDGLRADDLKIKAIRDMLSPQNLAELHTIMGMITTWTDSPLS